MVFFLFSPETLRFLFKEGKRDTAAMLKPSTQK